MSSNTLETSYTNGQVIDASHINEVTLALLGGFVGRDASGVPSPGQSLGTLSIPWGALYCKSVILDGLALDTTQITSIPNRIISGKKRSLSLVPDFLRANGLALSFQVLGLDTNLVVSINNTAATVSSNVEKTGLTAAPSANNTCLVNDTTLLNSKTAGEDGGVIRIDTVGSNVSSQVGQLVAFKVGTTSEILIGYLRDATSITNVFRGYFFDSSGNPLVRDNLSDNTTLTIMNLGWVFLEDNGTTVDVSYRTPVISFDAPTSPATGYYWFDIANQSWKRYSGVSWEIINRTLIGSVVMNDTACIATRCIDFSLNYSNQNNAFVVKKTSEIVEIRELSSRISVYGTQLSIDFSKPDWNLTTDLETGLVEAANTTYYCYISENGKTIISDKKPYERLDLNGFYHPYESWRCIAKFLNNASSEIINVRQIGKTIDNFIGIIFEYAGNVTPEDCLRCDGSSLKRADFPELFNAIGTSWGTVDADHFNIPDVRGLVKRGWANGSARDPDRASRTAIATGGATGDNVATYQGDTVGAHSHTIGLWAQGLAAGNGIPQCTAAPPTGGTAGTNNNTGTNETRMRNVAVNCVIKYR